MNQESDFELLSRARQGDSAAMEALLGRHETRVYRFALRMCGNEADAQDVMQETLLAAFKGVVTFRHEAQWSTWLYQVARSFCIKQRRGKKQQLPHAPLTSEEARHVSTDAAQVEGKAHARQMGEVIQAAMNVLSDDFREALVLRDVEGLSAEEAAQVVGIEVGALKSRLHRARFQLKKNLSAVLEDSPEELDCPGLKQAFSDYAASDIDQAACASIESHLKACARCHEACESLKRTVSLCRALPGGAVPLPVKAAVQKALRGAVP